MGHAEQTTAEAGFHMPAEWEPHAGCLMAWPCRADLWGGRLDEARADYAAVARAIAGYEPVLMACKPGDAASVRSLCGEGIEPLEVPLDDSWARDSGPIFVRDADGRVAVVDFVFNAWGERWHPYADDALLARRVADHLGMRVFSAPFVLEGGSIFVDGEGTVLTTEQCLLNPNRNPNLTREQIEQGLRDYLGVSTVLWIPFGHSADVGPAGTDGHIDGVAQYIAPGHLLLEAPSDPASADFERGLANLERLEKATDAQGRELSVSVLDPGAHSEVSYSNLYLPDGAAVVPLAGDDRDQPALARVQELFPDREVVGVPGSTLAFGGGGPHCITQQIPAGPAAPPPG